MHRVVVVLLLLDAHELGVLDLDLAAEGLGDHVREVEHAEGLRELVEDPVLALAGRVEAGELDARQRVADVERAARLSALPVDGQRVAGHGLDREPVEHRPEDAVVVEAGEQLGVQQGLVGLLAVHDALVEVRGPHPPDPAAELDVVRVVHLGEVVEAVGVLRERERVGPALVGDLDEPLFDLDVRGPVLAHRPELHQVDRGVDLRDRVEDVEGVHDVVVLRVDGVLLVDHRVRRGPLLGEVHDRVGPELADHPVGEVRVDQVADPAGDLAARDLPPDLDPALELGDRDEGVDPHLEVVLASDTAVDDAHLVALVGQVQGGGPPEVAVSAEDEDAHAVLLGRGSWTRPSGLLRSETLPEPPKTAWVATPRVRAGRAPARRARVHQRSPAPS